MTQKKNSQAVASIFSLLNDFRLSNNRKPLGFINPLLYLNASSGFTDIDSGSNPGCGTSGNSVLAYDLWGLLTFLLIRFSRCQRLGPSEYSSRCSGSSEFFLTSFLDYRIGYGLWHTEFFETERARRMHLITHCFRARCNTASRRETTSRSTALPCLSESFNNWFSVSLFILIIGLLLDTFSYDMYVLHTGITSFLVNTVNYLP